MYNRHYDIYIYACENDAVNRHGFAILDSEKNTITRFDRIQESDGQTDRHRMTA